jgi:hypothetical protein
MHESIIPVKLIRERVAKPRRVRSLWMTLFPGSIVEVENNRMREQRFALWMRCRVHRVVGDELWVIPMAY